MHFRNKVNLYSVFPNSQKGNRWDLVSKHWKFRNVTYSSWAIIMPVVWINSFWHSQTWMTGKARRVVIEFLIKEGYSAVQIHARRTNVNGDSAVHRNGVIPIHLVLGSLRPNDHARKFWLPISEIVKSRSFNWLSRPRIHCQQWTIYQYSPESQRRYQKKKAGERRSWHSITSWQRSSSHFPRQNCGYRLYGLVCCIPSTV